MTAWQVTILRPTEAADCRALERLVSGGVAVLDQLAAQVADLVDARVAGRRLDAAERARLTDEVTGGEPLARYGRWVHFPWHHEVVRLLPPDAFHELRTDRNRHRITARDQAALRQRRIAIAGLSVGLASAVTLAAEGIGGAFHLADLDTLSLSNMNRLPVAVRDLGASKAEIAARRLLDLDPYLEIVVFPEGVRDDNLDAFLGPTVDLLVEECDDLEMKLQLRERARARRIPVLMETSDRGLLDIERFDLEPDRPILHGVVAGLRAADLRGLGPAQKLVPLARIVDVDRVSPALAASVVELNHTTASWPQLASAVGLGGAVVADTARRILLGQIDWSGRHYVDLEQLVSRAALAPLSGPPAPDAPDVRNVPDAPLRGPARTGDPSPSPDELRWLVAQAIKAPSGGNSQPWRFELRAGEIRCAIDPARCHDTLSYDGLAPAIALGAAVENLVLSAPVLGLVAEVELADAPLAVVKLRRAVAPSSPLAHAIDTRACHRAAAEPTPLSVDERRGLLAVAPEDGVCVELHDDRAILHALAHVAGAWDRLRVLSTTMHPELVRELRWTHREAVATRDGIELACLELPPRLELGLRVVARADTAAVLRAIDGGAGLRDGALQAHAQASALGRFLVRHRTRRDFFQLGRTMQRWWLTATLLGIGARPYGAYLFAVAQLDGVALDAADRAALTALATAHRAAMPVATRPGWTDGFLLLLNRAPPPAVRSLRRALDDVLD